MKIKVKDLTDDLVDQIDKFECEENCEECSFCDDKFMCLNDCVANFINSIRMTKHFRNEEIDISSLYSKKYSNVIEMCEDLELDKDFISDLKESIQKKEEVQKDLGVIFKYLKDFSAGSKVMKSFENIENYLENEV